MAASRLARAGCVTVLCCWHWRQRLALRVCGGTATRHVPGVCGYELHAVETEHRQQAVRAHVSINLTNCVNNCEISYDDSCDRNCGHNYVNCYEHNCGANYDCTYDPNYDYCGDSRLIPLFSRAR